MGKSVALNHELLLAPDVADRIVAKFDLGMYTTDAFLYQQVFQDPRVLEWQRGDTTLLLALDWFDEGSARVPTLWRMLAGWLGGVDRDRLVLRIACRTADWPSSLGNALSRLFSSPAIVELLPFRRSDVVQIAEALSMDAERFVGEVEQHGASVLAARPLTLRLLLAAFASEGEISGGGAMVYARGCAALVGEANQMRRDSGSQLESEAALLEAAEQIAACTLFSGSVAVSIAASAATKTGDVTLDDCFCVGDDIGRRAGGAVLQSALFAGAGESRLRWSHATFADYLAARWVIRMELSDDDVRTLCVTHGGRIFGPTQHLAAWLVALESSRFEWLIEGDPTSFLTNIDLPSESLRARLVDHMLRDLRAGRTYDDWSWALNGLMHAQLAAQLLPTLESTEWSLVDFAIRLARACMVDQLADALLAIIQNSDAPRSIRTSAAVAVREIGLPADASETLSLLIDGSLKSLEDGAELWAAIARMLWPNVLGTSSILRLSAPRPRENLLGMYSIFMHELAVAVQEDDLPAALDWVHAHRSTVLTTHERVLDTAVVKLCIEQLDNPDAVNELKRRSAERARLFEPILGDDIDVGSLAVDTRHRLAQILSEDADEELAYALVSEHHSSRGSLLRADDFGWLLDELDRGPETRAAALGRAARYLFRESDRMHVDTVLSLAEDSNARPHFADLLGAWRLDSPQATSARQYWLDAKSRTAKIEKKRGKARGKWVDGHIREALDGFEAGDLTAYWQASRLLTVRPGTDRYFDYFEPDLTKHVRWESLPQEIHERFLQHSIEFLLHGECEPGNWLGQPVRHYPSEAAYRALTLLLRLAPERLDTLPSTAWAEWAPIIVAWPVMANGADAADKTALISLAAPYAREQMEDAVLAIIDKANEDDEPINLRTELAALQSRRLSEALHSRINHPGAAKAAEVILDYLTQTAPDLARLTLEAWVDDAALRDTPARAAGATLRLVQDFCEGSWPRISELLATNPQFMRDVFLLPGLGYHRRVPEIGEAELAQLWLWLEEAFPESGDPRFDDVHTVGPRETVGRFRDDVLGRLRNTPTDAAVNAVRNLVTRFPERASLRRALADVERRAGDAVWRPIASEALLTLALEGRRTFVRNARDLWQQTQAALDAVEVKLQTDSPVAHLLWDTHSRRPKTEDELSDFLLHELRERLSRSGATVNREVPSRRGSPSGLANRPDIRVEAVLSSVTRNTPPITLPIEVKGSWHADVLTAASDQLANGYMPDLGVNHGIYVAFWFDADSWDPADSRRRRGKQFPSAQFLHDAIESALESRGGAEGVAIRVLDASIQWQRS